MPPGQDPVVILHLSDLHFGPHCRFAGRGAGGLGTLAQRLAGSVAQAREAHGIEPVALVIATGDIVEYGNQEQYQDAGTFFTALAEALEISPARLLFVPGNHDVSWPHCEQAEVDQKIHGFDAHELERRIHHDKLAPYRDFQSAFYQCAPAALAGATALSAGRAHAFVHAYDDIGVSVAALDSCERETHRVHGGQLGEVQAQALMDHWRADARAHLRIVAVHHNPVADAPANIAAWAEGLMQSRPDDESYAALIDHFAADATGFDGRKRLQRVTRDCQVSLVLHGHVHTAGLTMWPGGNGFDHTLVSAAGSWGLADGRRPADEPMSMQLLRLGPARNADGSAPRLEAIRLSYNPRARQPGHVEPGDFVIDGGEDPVRNLSLSLPANHPGFCAAGAGGPGPGGLRTRVEFTQDERDQITVCIEACAAVRDPQTRAQILLRLPDEIQRSIPHAPTLRAHVTSMVETCARFEGGLRQLRKAVRHFEGDTFPMQEVDALLRRLGVLADEQP